jgi:hypothetical protein
MRYRHAVTGVEVDVRDDKELYGDWESVGGSSAGSEAEGYEALTVDELKDEIRSRNEDRDDETRLALSGSKADLIAALEADD